MSRAAPIRHWPGAGRAVAAACATLMRRVSMLSIYPRRARARRCSLLFGVLIAALLPSHLQAQQDGTRSRTWLGAGLGGGYSLDSDGIALMAELVHQRGAHHFAVRALTIFDPGGDDHVASELGILYGRSWTRSLGHVALAGGIAGTTVNECADGEPCTAIGFPIVLEAAFRPFSFIGVGVQAFGNINNEQRYRGVVAFVQLGWLP